MSASTGRSRPAPGPEPVLRIGGAAVRSPADIDAMAAAGRVVAEMHRAIRTALRPGVTTAELDRVARAVLEEHEATSNFLGYGRPPFPATICASPNDIVIHGVPSDDIVLTDGDLISVDCGAVVDGWHGDAAFTATIGDGTPADCHLIERTEAALAAAIAVMVPGNRLGDIGHAVETVAIGAGLSILEGFGGHGIGRQMHEPPSVANRGRPRTGMRLRAGHVLAVEPMLIDGDPDVYLDEDGWTIRTVGGARAAHAEHTIAITDDGPRVLTVLDG